MAYKNAEDNKAACRAYYAGKGINPPEARELKLLLI